MDVLDAHSIGGDGVGQNLLDILRHRTASLARAWRLAFPVEVVDRDACWLVRADALEVLLQPLVRRRLEDVAERADARAGERRPIGWRIGPCVSLVPVVDWP